MIFADKLIELRKKNGMTQEELAEKMNVSRQSVSKWEGAQSAPDLDKVLKLSGIFGVSTDYLLKDELESPEFVEVKDDAPRLRQVGLEEASEYLALKEQTAGPMALGVMLCILSPVCLLMLAVFGDMGLVSEDLAGGLGVVILLGMVAGAVAIFLGCGAKTEAYGWLEKEAFETVYGVDGMVRERQKRFRPAYVRRMTLGVALCILSPAPLLLAAALTENEIAIIGCVCALLGLVALGVGFILLAAVPWESMQKLLQEGDFTPAKKRSAKVTEAIGAVYWLVATAAYLGYSFVTGDWGRSWILWPVAGVLYGAVCAVCGLFLKDA